MAQATPVNIADPTATARMAKVEPGNRLAVQDVAPTSYFHAFAGGNAASGCFTIAAPLSGKALIVRQVRVDATKNDTPGQGQFVSILTGGCSTIVGDVNPPTVGQTTVTFDPALAIPAGQTLDAQIGGAVVAEIYVDGYTVASGVAPAASQTIQINGHSQQHR